MSGQTAVPEGDSYYINSFHQVMYHVERAHVSERLLGTGSVVPDWLSDETERVAHKLNELLGEVSSQDLDLAARTPDPDEAPEIALLRDKAGPYLAYRSWLLAMEDFLRKVNPEEYQRRYRRYVRTVLDEIVNLALEQRTKFLFGKAANVKNQIDALTTERINVLAEGYRSKQNFREQDSQSILFNTFEEDIYWMMATALGPKSRRDTPLKQVLRLLGGLDVTLQYLPGHREASQHHHYYSRTPEKEDRSVLRKAKRGFFG